jgi:UDP-N-acetylglucosamine--N-acetylmuramyl-(pentapeptide) pyrophosphoryl-undecaprenol N-acetylglucosamine transferase
MTRRIAMAVGDTAGHVLPAVAIADAYTEAFGDVDVSFLAGEGGSASRLLSSTRYSLHTLPATPLVRVSLTGRLMGAARVLPTFVRTRGLLTRRNIKLVIGTGGYGSGGALLAARSRGLRIAVVEPNAFPGLANRLLSRVAHRAYVMFDEAAQGFPSGRALNTGLPLLASRRRLLRDRTPPSADRPVRLLVTSGSRGDAFLAEHIPVLVARLQDRRLRLTVRHQVSSGDQAALGRRYLQLHVDAQVVPFLDDVAEAYDWADMIIARAGAGTLAELALGGIPSLLVPLADAAADHQSANAAAFADRGAALWIREPEWSIDRAVALLEPLLRDPTAWQAMSSAARALARPDAAAAIVRDCEQLMQNRW